MKLGTISEEAHSDNENRDRVVWEERSLDVCQDVQSVWVCYE